MNKRKLTVSVLTAGLSVGVVAGTVGPAAAQGNPVGGSGSYFFLSGAGSTGGAAQKIINFGNPGDETYFGDWDGNGTDTPMVRRGNTFFVSDDNGQLQSIFSYGDAGEQVYIGDWNGDKIDSIAIRRSNAYLVKNDNKKTGTADTQFSFGDAVDKNVLVGDWDDKDGDSLMIQRGNRFFVANANKTGNADFEFSYGDPGNTVLVGDWADPANSTSGDGKDQIAVRQGANTYVLSNELGDGKNVKELRRYNYGDAGDQVFVAALSTPVLDKDGKPVVNTKHLVTYDSDQTASYKGGEPLIVPNGSGGFKVKQDDTGKYLTRNAGDPKVHLKGEEQVYLGTEPVLGLDGQPLKYTAYDSSKSVHPVTDITASTQYLDANKNFQLYKAGDPVLDADGMATYYVDPSAHVVTPVTWVNDWTGISDADKPKFRALSDLASKDRYITPKAGDPILHRRGETINMDPNAQLTADDLGKTGQAIVLHDAEDLVLDDKGQPKTIGTGTTPASATVTVSPSNGVGTVSGTNTLTPKFTAGAPTGASITFTSTTTGIDGSATYVWKVDGATVGGGANLTQDFSLLAPGDHTVTLAVSTSGGTASQSTTTPAQATVRSAAASTTTGLQKYKDLTHDAGTTGTVYQSKNGGTTFVQSQAATYGATDKIVHRSGEAVVGWTWNSGSHKWEALNLPSDEAAGAYAMPGDSNGYNASQVIADLDEDTTGEPMVYKGGEPVTSINKSVTDGTAFSAPGAVDPYKGGESVVTHHAGDPILDDKGNVQYEGDDKALVITGDGLGVRRSFN